MTKFCFIEFIDGSGTEIVPRSWIEKQGALSRNEEVQTAFPPRSQYKHLRTYVQKEMTPSTTWSSFNGRVLCLSDDLDNLRKKSSKYYYDGTLSSTDYENGRKRIEEEVYKESSKIINPEETLSSDDDSIICASYTTSSLQLKNLNTSQSSASSDAPPAASTSMRQSLTTTPSSSRKVPQLEQIDQERNVSLTENATATPPVHSTQNLTFSSRSLLETRKAIETKLGVDLKTSNGLVLLLVSQQLQIQKLTEEIARLRKSVEKLPASNSRICTSIYDGNPLFNPANSFQDYLNLALTLKEKEFQDKAVRYLVRCGGDNAHECVSRMVPKMLSHAMQCKVTLTGKCMPPKAEDELARTFSEKELSFKKLLFPTLFRAVVSIKNTTTESELENSLKDFFKRANDREGGRERRRKRARNNEQQ